MILFADDTLLLVAVPSVHLLFEKNDKGNDRVY